MPVDLHLFSLAGINNIDWIIEACRPYLQRQADPLVGLMQWASVSNDWSDYTRRVFAPLGRVAVLDFAPEKAAETRAALERCGAVYISGGNTYLLNHRLHESGLFAPLREMALAGLPLVGFSAGAVLCGPNILTTHDINMLPTTHFYGLDLIPFNLVAHYPETDPGRDDEDDWLSDYHAAHANPILALENDGYARWDGERLEYVRGGAWILEAGQGRRRLGPA